MITLKADNRNLTKNSKFSYLSDNYLSGVSALVVTSDVGFSTNDYVLIGEWGSETTEILKISSVTSATKTLNLSSATKFSHSESTKIYILDYNQVRFYHTTTTTFSATDPVTGYIDIQPDSYFTVTEDATNTTGYGWFIFYNSTTTSATTYSNPIPYGGFSENSVKKILDIFYSMLNNKEQKLIDNADAFRWLNEAYAKAQNELNLVNNNYTIPTPYSISIVSGTAEYALPDAFGKIIAVYYNSGGENLLIDCIDILEVPKYNSFPSIRPKYYLRGTYIGFSPTPTSSATYYVYHNQKSSVLTSYYDNVDLPNNNFYFIVDWMLYRAKEKLLDYQTSLEHKKAFGEGIASMKMTAHKQSNNPESWTISQYANV